MLVPAATSMGMRCSASQRITPTWAMPRALPPPKATPMEGRDCAEYLGDRSCWDSWTDTGAVTARGR